MPSKNIVDFANQVKSYALGIKDQQVLGAWNLMYSHIGLTQTNNGITWTVLSDGTIKVNGTATAESRFYYNDDTLMLEKGKDYYLSGGTNACKGYIALYKNGSYAGKYYTDNGGERLVNINSSIDFDEIKPHFIIPKGTTVNNLIVKPMIALEPNQPYVPYAMTNRELTDKVAGIIDAVNNASDFASFKTAIGNL